MSEFDLKAKDWDTPDKIERAGTIANAIRSHIKLNNKMSGFEYGCGTGLLSFELRHDIGDMTLADSSDGMLDVLKEKIKAESVSSMKPVKLDLMKDPVPDQRFDIIYTMLTLHHIPDTERILRYFHRMLNEGGHLCIADLDKEDGSFHGKTAHFHNGFDRKELIDITRNAGFDDVSIDTAGSITRETEHGAKNFPVFLMIAKRS